MQSQLQRLTSALASRYSVVREIGRGGMATVYLAEDPRHRRQVAIKVFSAELAEALGKDRFLREIELTAGLTHPHILPLYDSGVADGLAYYVMPFVDGHTLRERLAEKGRLPLDEALRIVKGVADALAFAHRKGIVHRDIKPENVAAAGRARPRGRLRHRPRVESGWRRGADTDRDGRRHAGLHEPGADRRGRNRGRAERHLQSGVPPVRVR